MHERDKYAQTIEPPTKKDGRRQLNFPLTKEEEDLTRAFTTLCGSRNRKAVLLQFMRAFVEAGGKLSVLPRAEVANALGNTPEIKVELTQAASGHSTPELNQLVTGAPSEPYSTTEWERLHKLLDEIGSSPIEEFRAGVVAALESWGIVARLMRNVDVYDVNEGNRDAESLEHRERRIAIFERDLDEIIRLGRAGGRRDQAG